MIEQIDPSSPKAIAERWLEELRRAENTWSKYRKRVDKLVKRYTDEADAALSELSDRPKKLNILWANVETIKPALYNQMPKAEVGRRNKDKDPVGREASEIIERGLEYCNDAYDFDCVIRDSVHDYALQSLGLARVVYDPLIEDDTLVAEYAKIDYVNPDDFLCSDARRWSEVRWVAFRHFFTREELVSLSPEHGKVVELDYSPDGEDKVDNTPEFLKKAVVWEIWDKQTKTVYYVAKSYAEAPLKVREPFCQFKDFLPMPRPLMGVKGKSLVPTPDYTLYQDQAQTIDELTDKIYTLTKALKVAGVYNASVAGLQNILEGDSGNKMIPVEDWSAFQQGGGTLGAMQFMPMKEVAETLIAAYQARQQAKQDLYEATGLSDIVRGASDPNETATAQSIKNQWGSLRIRDRQKEVQRFIRDLMRLKGEVIAERFSLETLKAMSGIQLLSEQEKAMAMQQMQAMPPEQQAQAQEILSKPTWEQVYALLQDDRMRSFSIDIETDSTIEPNESEEKAARVEFLTAMGGFLQQMAQAVMQAPETAPMLGDLLTFGVRGFKVGSELESSIENAMDAVKKRLLAPPQPPQPDPTEVAKLEADKEKTQAQLQAEMQKHQASLGLEAKKHQDGIALEAKKHEDSINLEVAKLRNQRDIEGAKLHQSDKKMTQDAAQKQAEAAQEETEESKEYDVNPNDLSMEELNALLQKKQKQADSETAEKEERRAQSKALLDALMGIQAALGEQIKAINKPKRIVRGKDGRAEGVE